MGFIGLGTMGGPMAANLVRAGFDVLGYDVAPARVDRLAAAGGRPAGSGAEVTAGADVVITVLPDRAAVEQVALGEDGVLDNAASGRRYIDMSTAPPPAYCPLWSVGRPVTSARRGRCSRRSAARSSMWDRSVPANWSTRPGCSWPAARRRCWPRRPSC